MNGTCGIFGLVALALASAASCVAQQYTGSGELILPADYREWVFLSSGIGMTYSNQTDAHPIFDNVFVNLAAARAFQKTGQWPDGTVLLTENRLSASHASNKDGKFQTKLVGFEAHVKDSKRGGWSFYFIRAGAQSGQPFPKTAVCFSCHAKNGAVDTTFVQFYPTLIDAAKKAGTYKDPGDVR